MSWEFTLNIGLCCSAQPLRQIQRLSLRLQDQAWCLACCRDEEEWQVVHADRLRKASPGKCVGWGSTIYLVPPLDHDLLKAG